MKRRLFLAALVSAIALAGHALAQNPGSGQPQNTPAVGAQGAVKSGGKLASKSLTNFTSKAAQFSIYFPVTPTEKRSKRSSSEGAVEEIVYHSKTGRATYIVMATKIPKQLRATRGSAEYTAALTRLRKGFETRGEGSKLIKSQKIIQNGISGWEVQKSMGQGDVNARIRIFVAPTRAYLVMATSLSGDHLTSSQLRSLSTQVTKVLDSFQVLG